MIVKVCGMRDAANIKAVDGLGIDLMGFIFYDKSPRAAKGELARPQHASPVGVFVDAPLDTILEKAGDFPFIQLHGFESPELCQELRNRGYKVIKAFRIKDASDLQQTAAYASSCDFFLFDTKTELAGGSGQSFDWTVLEAYKGPVPFLLSGGIGPETDLSGFSHPFLAGYDLNSRFEIEPGLKDIDALENYLRKLS